MHESSLETVQSVAQKPAFGIIAAISRVMSDIGAVGKTSVNKQQDFKYRGIDAVMNALQPALIKHNVCIVPEVLEQAREERITSRGNNLIYAILKVRYDFYASDGTCVSATVIGEGMDSGDKASNKAMSVAFKYACCQVFCIPTEEFVDPDGESYPESLPIKRKTQDAAQPPTTEQLEEFAKLGIDINAVAVYYKTNPDKLTSRQAQAAIEMKIKGMAAKRIKAETESKYNRAKALARDCGITMAEIIAQSNILFETEKINNLTDGQFITLERAVKSATAV